MKSRLRLIGSARGGRNVHYVKCTLTRPRQLELIAPVHKGSWRKWDCRPVSVSGLRSSFVRLQKCKPNWISCYTCGEKEPHPFVLFYVCVCANAHLIVSDWLTDWEKWNCRRSSSASSQFSDWYCSDISADDIWKINERWLKFVQTLKTSVQK